jgi:antitoxin component of MazEF toxin-antitoxin module
VYVRKIIRTGHSYAVTIPASELRRLDLKAGDPVGVTLEKCLRSEKKWELLRQN